MAALPLCVASIPPTAILAFEGAAARFSEGIMQSKHNCSEHFVSPCAVPYHIAALIFSGANRRGAAGAAVGADVITQSRNWNLRPAGSDCRPEGDWLSLPMLPYD